MLFAVVPEVASSLQTHTHFIELIEMETMGGRGGGGQGGGGKQHVLLNSLCLSACGWTCSSFFCGANKNNESINDRKDFHLT